MGGLAGVAGAATGMWIEAALLPVGATVLEAAAAGAAGGFAAGVVEQSILELSGAAILGTEMSAERILLAGVTGGVTGGLFAGVSRWWRMRAAAGALDSGGGQLSPQARAYLNVLREEGDIVAVPRGQISTEIMAEMTRETGVEFALVRARGQRMLVRGYEIGVIVPADTTRFIAHTHIGTYATLPGSLDRQVLQYMSEKYGQTFSMIISEAGLIGRFRP